MCVCVCVCVCAHVLVCTLLIAKGRDAHWPRPNVLTAVGRGLYSELTQQSKQDETNTAWLCLQKSIFVHKNLFLKRPAEARGWLHGPNSKKSGFSCYLADPAACVDLKPEGVAGRRRGFLWINTAMLLLQHLVLHFYCLVFDIDKHRLAIMNKQMQSNYLSRTTIGTTVW